MTRRTGSTHSGSMEANFTVVPNSPVFVFFPKNRGRRGRGERGGGERRAEREGGRRERTKREGERHTETQTDRHGRKREGGGK